MPDKYQLQVYSIEGRMNFLPPYGESANDLDSGNIVGGQVSADSPNKESSKEQLLAYLNKYSPQIAQEISVNIRKFLPTYVHYTIETEMSFFEGSLIISGTVILAASWAFLQPILEDSAKKALGTAFETGFNQLIEAMVKRVVSSWLPRFIKENTSAKLPQMAEPMQVKAELVTNMSANTIDSQQSQQRPPEQTQALQTSSERARPQQAIPLYFRGLVLADTLLLLIIIIITLIPHIKLIP